MTKTVNMPAYISEKIKRNKNTVKNDSIYDVNTLPDSIVKAAEIFSGNNGSAAESLTSEDYLDKMIREASSFSYDVNTDPLYKQYRDMYEKESSLAAKNIFGLASALTGGYGNSWAVSAVSGAVNDYLDNLTKKADSLRDDAYEKHRDSISDLYNIYKSRSDIEDKEYDRMKEAEKEQREAEKEARETENEEQQQAYSLAFKAADIGDYSLLEKLGIDTSSLIKSDLEKRAELLAKYGDYSGLQNMGIDISQLEKEELTEIARLFATYGDYSLLRSLGADTENKETEDYYSRLLLKARYWNLL